jgi:hypothetical protein
MNGKQTGLRHSFAWAMIGVIIGLLLIIAIAVQAVCGFEYWFGLFLLCAFFLIYAIHGTAQKWIKLAIQLFFIVSLLPVLDPFLHPFSVMSNPDYVPLICRQSDFYWRHNLL